MAAARIYSIEDVGITTALISSLNLITLFSLFGFDYSLIRFLPISNNRKVYNTCLVITSFFHDYLRDLSRLYWKIFSKPSISAKAWICYGFSPFRSFEYDHPDQWKRTPIFKKGA
jgi:hypothetical protein